MIQKDFTINFEEKTISRSPKAGKKVYPAVELYSYLMDVFDEPENMRYDIPIDAVSKSEFRLINDWRIDKDGMKHLEGKIS